MKESGQHEEEEVVEVGVGCDDGVVEQGMRQELIRLDAVPLLIKLEVEEVLKQLEKAHLRRHLSQVQHGSIVVGVLKQLQPSLVCLPCGSNRVSVTG
jgi:hypothetical protein